MLTKICIIAVAVLILQVSGLPSRVKRQGFQWGDDDDTLPNRPQSSSTSVPSGTTTTTASPEYTTCDRACPKTPQYNPVCGTNGRTYQNESHLRCAVRCGLTVEIAFGGSCRPA